MNPKNEDIQTVEVNGTLDDVIAHDISVGKILGNDGGLQRGNGQQFNRNDHRPGLSTPTRGFHCREWTDPRLILLTHIRRPCTDRR